MPDLILKPTPAERFWLKRRRLGLTQEEMARRLGLGEKEYLAVELGAVPPREGIRVPALKPKRGELCELARRRSESSLDHVAAEVGVSRVTLRAWERAGDPRLVAAWEGMGYRF